MIDLTVSFRPLNTSLQSRAYSLQGLRVQTHQESDLTILSTPLYENCQPRHFTEHTNPAIL